MSRCPMYEQSRFAYKAKRKMCRFPSEIRTVIPTSDFRKTGEFVTEITFAWVCMKHYALLHAHKQQAIKDWIAKDVKAIADLNGSTKHVENFHG